MENSDNEIVEIEKLKNKIKIKEIKFDLKKAEWYYISKYCEINHGKKSNFLNVFWTLA